MTQGRPARARARKLRAFVTCSPCLLGVALIAGTYVLTDTINRSFDDIFSEAYEGTDVVDLAEATSSRTSSRAAALPGRVLDRVREVRA